MVSSFYFDKGDFAPSQQDALVLEEAALGKKEEALLAVCDGIGGLQSGEYASSYVTMRIRDWFYADYLKLRKGKYGRRRIERDCVRMLYDCSRFLKCYGEEYGIKLGTTMTMVLLQGRGSYSRYLLHRPAKYLIFHVGDSRAYLLGRKSRKLTEDDSGEDNVLHRCIGSFLWRGVQKRRGFLWPGERILLCSDGFWRRLEMEEMKESLSGRRGPEKNAGMTEEQMEKRLRKLGEASRARGERDNQAAAIIGMK